MKLFKQYLIPVCLLFFSSCIKQTCMEGAGENTIFEKNIEPVDSIFLNDNINIVITQAIENKIKIVCGNNLQPYITATIKNRTLTLNNTVKCQWLRNPSEKITVYLQLSNIAYLHYSGYGNVQTTNTIATNDFFLDVGDGSGIVDMQLLTNNISINNNGSADILLKGKSNNGRIYTSFRGIFDLKNFEIKNLEVDFRSVFNGYLFVTESLKGTIKHTGNLYYHGNPATVNVTTTGSGKLIQL